MRFTFAKFHIQGYVGNVREVGKTLKLRISRTESWKDRQTGERQERTTWATVTIFENMPGFSWIKEHLKAGDLVSVQGNIFESSYDKNGSTLYDTTLSADEVAILPTGKSN